MTVRARLNFIVTNRVPRRLLTRFMGRFSRIENRLVRAASIGAFRLFARDMDLHEARKTRFNSLHDCFVRELKPGARPIDGDPAVMVSPCDGVVCAAGAIQGTELIQAKGRRYTLEDLLKDFGLVRAYRNGTYVTLRLKPGMYHRFHAPDDCRVQRVVYVPGDVWNVNPPTLSRVDRLYARNERAVITARLRTGGHLVTMVPVAAVLVASIRLHFLDLRLHLGFRGPHVIDCDAGLSRGQEMGWFEHGSTLIVFAPEGFLPCAGVEHGAMVRMGRPLLRRP